MRVEHHITTSAIISGTLYIIFKSSGLAISSFIIGIFVDLDHIMDYVIEHGFNLNLRKFFRYFIDKRCRKAFFILHGWEWLTILFLSAAHTNWNPWISGLLIGYAQHLIFDQLFNGSSKWGYSFLWRWKYKFDYKAFCPHGICK